MGTKKVSVKCISTLHFFPTTMCTWYCGWIEAVWGCLCCFQSGGFTLTPNTFVRSIHRAFYSVAAITVCSLIHLIYFSDLFIVSQTFIASQIFLPPFVSELDSSLEFMIFCCMERWKIFFWVSQEVCISNNYSSSASSWEQNLYTHCW